MDFSEENFWTLVWCSYILFLKGLFGFTNVLVATFFTIYDVNQVSKFTGNFVFNRHVFAFKYLIRVKAGNLINFLDSRTVGAFT